MPNREKNKLVCFFRGAKEEGAANNRAEARLLSGDPVGVHQCIVAGNVDVNRWRTDASIALLIWLKRIFAVV